MRWRLGGRGYSVMTANACLSNGIAVIKSNIPVICGMAHITCIGGDDVVDVFPNGDNAIMAGFADANCLCMVNSRDGCPARIRVACATLIA